MTPESVMNIGRHAMEITVMISAPLLLVALIIGLIVSIIYTSWIAIHIYSTSRCGIRNYC